MCTGVGESYPPTDPQAKKIGMDDTQQANSLDVDI